MPSAVPFAKYHALGNDYIVIAPPSNATHPVPPQPEQIQRICHRNYGIGSDGILFGPLPSERCDMALRIFNPDGSEAEKSGNGLRIFARYLYDQNRVTEAPFRIETAGGEVEACVAAGGREVTVAMGQVSFDSERIPVAGSARQVLNENLSFDGDSGATGDALTLRYCAASVGNPHCIVLCDETLVPSELVRRYGPLIEKDPRFPNRTNVQFMQRIDQQRIRIEIWERGAGYTLASGSSSTACAAVAYKLGWCDAAVTVAMPGGEIQIQLDAQFNATMTGAVQKIATGEMASEAFA